MVWQVFEAMQRTFCFLLCLAGLVNCYGQDSIHSSTVTLSAGGEVPTYNQFGESNGPAFRGNYEFRLLKYLALEAGVETMLPKTTQYLYSPVFNLGQPSNVFFSSSSPYVLIEAKDTEQNTFLPFGVKGILPVRGSRIELLGGFGGAYVWHSDGSFRNAWVTQTNVGARIAVDQGRHFWLGTSGHFYSNFGSRRQEWLSWTADLGLRFGR